MQMLSKAWKTFKSLVFCQLCLAIVFLTTGIVVNLIQAFLYITVRPFNPRLYRKINYYVTYMLNSQVVFLCEWWSGSHSGLYGDPEVVKQYFGEEHALLLLNHGCEVDWLMGWVLCDRCRVLGNARVYAKKILQYAPVLGWSWKFQEIVFLDRNWEKDRRNLGTQLTRLASYPDPIWLTLFPEGTRYTEEKYEASMKVAREKGLPELKRHLLPRTKGFVASIPYLKGKVAAIYDVVVTVDPSCTNEPSVFSLVKGRRVITQLLMRRIPMTEVPDDEKEAAAWLHRLYQQKDKVLDNYMTTGRFVPVGKEDSEEYAAYKNFDYIFLPRRPYSLINFCFWSATILLPLAWYLYLQLTSGSLVRIAIVAVLCFAAYYGFNTLMNLTKISKGSEYGSTPVKNGHNHNENTPATLRSLKPHLQGKSNLISNGNGTVSNGTSGSDYGINGNAINGGAKKVSSKNA